MKSMRNGLVLLLLISASAVAQKPAWVQNPGTYAADNFVAVGIAKDSKLDKAKAKAESKARNGIEGLLKNKYDKKEIKAAMASLKMQAYWQDPMTSYYYVLALLPFDAIDKDYKAQKQAEKTKSSAMGALKMLNAMTSDPDVVIIKVDMNNDDNSAAVSKSDESGVTAAIQPKKEEAKKEEVKKEVAVVKTEVKNEESKGSSSTSSAAVSSGVTMSDFKNKTLGSFKWLDQDQNSKYSFLDDGLMTVNTAAGEWWEPEKDYQSAPRMVTDMKGSFTVEARVKMDWQKSHHSGFGLCAFNGKQNVRVYTDYDGAYLYFDGYANDIALPKAEKTIEAFKGFAYLKLVHSGYKWTAYYSTIADDWVEIGSFETEFPETCKAGMYFNNWEGTTVSMKVEYLKITQ
jgi:hypothetical protein